MDVADYVGAGQTEHVVVALQLPLGIDEALATEVVLLQVVLLNERSHGSVEYEHALLGNFVNRHHL